MNNKILIIFTLLMIAFLVCGATGCQYKLPWQKAGEEITTGRGITAQFRTGEPPLDGIYASDKDNFQVAIELTNYGQNSVSVQACISDTPSNFFSNLEKKCEAPLISGAEQVDSQIYPGKAILDFGKFHYLTNRVTKGMTTNIIVDLLTRYRIELSPQICVKRADAELSDVNCEDTSTISGSDLGIDANTIPVTVTKMEKQVWPIDENTFNVHLRIFFDNLGTGKLYNENEPTRQILKDYLVELVGVGHFTCTPNEVYLDEGERSVTCDLEVKLEDDEIVRRNPVLITFNYNYRILASTGEIPIIIPKGASSEKVSQTSTGEPSAYPEEYV